MRKMEGVHGYEPSIHKEKDKKMASYISDWIGKEGRKVEMTWEVKHGEEKVWIRGKTGHMSQKGVSFYQ